MNSMDDLDSEGLAIVDVPKAPSVPCRSSQNPSVCSRSICIISAMCPEVRNWHWPEETR